MLKLPKNFATRRLTLPWNINGFRRHKHPIQWGTSNTLKLDTPRWLRKRDAKIVPSILACENIRFSSLFAAGDVSRGRTSATQRQKFHTDDAHQCLHNKSSSHGVPNINLSNFTCLLVDFRKVLCSSANELLQNPNSSSREDYILQILTVLLDSSRLHLTFVAFCLLSIIRKQ